MKKGRGRTSRIRRRKLDRSSQSRGESYLGTPRFLFLVLPSLLSSNYLQVNESYKPEFIALKKWLKARKFEDANLIPACFPGTGRGLMSKTSLQEGQVIISLPESCLLTTDTVLRSRLGAHIAKWRPPPSPLLALCAFLVAERHAGDRSPWRPYLAVLPEAYACAACLEPEVLALLPGPLAAAAREQRARVRQLFASARGFFSSLQPLLSAAAHRVFSFGAFLWAWCTVNTRAVYLARGPRPGLSAEPDTCALAPFLDLLNHSPAVQVEAAFNEHSRCYEVRTRAGCRPHQEVLVSYGAHDSRRLLLEYGFVPRGNPHACVPVPPDMLVKYLPSTDKQTNKKISILKDHDLIENLTFGWDGPSWRLLTALRLLCLEAAEFLSWKKVLRGEMISDANERTSLDVAQKICRCFTEEAGAMLQKVSHMKAAAAAATQQLTLVETLWAEELSVLRASAEALSSLQTALAPRPLPACPAGCDA